MADSTIWWVLAGGAVALELATGTFYLLMLAIGLAAGALAAYAGGAAATQFVTAAIVGGGAVAALYLQRRRGPKPIDAAADPAVNADVGQTVHVDRWAADGTATVRYRGTQWTVVAAPGSEHGHGAYRVREVVGSRLVVEKV